MKKRTTTEKIISLIFNMGRAMKKQCFDENKRGGGLSILQVEALWHIGEGKEVLMKDLASHLFITPPSATSLADELVKTRLVARSGDKNDRRTTAVSLTRKGKQALASFKKKRMEKVGKKIDLFSTGEKKAFLKLLEKLSKDYNR